jgi:dTDP-4-amino-4,6-dideoxygalactose transaminase
MSTLQIPFVDQSRIFQAYQDEMLGATKAVFESGKLIGGPDIQFLEKELAAVTGVNHAIACSNGSDALLMVLMAMGIGPGDAVLCPAFTFTATAAAICRVGATPVFLDVLDCDLTVDYTQIVDGVFIAKKAGLKPKALISVDIFGMPCHYDEIERIVQSLGLILIADNAQSFGSEFLGKSVMSYGTAATTSFYPNKAFGCFGDGGCIFTNDASLAIELRRIREHGQGEHSAGTVRIGMTGRLDTVQAAILSVRLRNITWEFKRRRDLAAVYQNNLEKLLCVPREFPGAYSIWAIFSIRCEYRDNLIRQLLEKGIETRIYYKRPLHLEAAFSKYPLCRPQLPIVEKICSQIVSLPLHPFLTDSELDILLNEIRGFFK